MNFLQKLDHMMAKLGLNKMRLSEISGVPYTTIDAFYKKGYENAKLSTVRRIATALDVTLDYLIVDEIENENYGKGELLHITGAEMVTIKKYRSLDPYGKETVDTVLEFERQRVIAQREEAEAHRRELELQRVKAISMQSRIDHLEADLRRAAGEPEGTLLEMKIYISEASAGVGNWLDEGEGAYEIIRVPSTPTTRRADFCLIVDGSSMEPKYSDGDLVFVHRCDDVPEGQEGIWVIDGKAYLKRRGPNKLLSLNPDYPDIEQGDAVRCIGIVIGKL